MAQHYELKRHIEPKIFKSVDRVAEYYVRASKYITRYLNDYTEEVVYKKKTTKLPDEYKIFAEDHLVLKVGKYDLQETKDLFGLYLECHIDEKGKVLSIYIVM
jgi:hypothetical protein